MTTDEAIFYAHLDAINSQRWAELAHAHIGDDGPAGELAAALATAVQLAEAGMSGQIMPSTQAATPKVALLPNPLEPWS